MKKYVKALYSEKTDNCSTVNELPTGEELSAVLMIKGKSTDIFNDHFTNKEIYAALQKCKKLLELPDVYHPGQITSPLSSRQEFCAYAAIKHMMNDKYNHALHELLDCIADYGNGKNRHISITECVLYKFIIRCFMSKLEDEFENVSD